VVDPYDRAAVANLLRGTDGAVHTATPGDATSADFDSGVVGAALDAFGETGKPYIPISGLWVYGNNLTHCRSSMPTPNSRPIVGSAMLTTVESSATTLDPSTVAAISHRPAAVEYRNRGPAIEEAGTFSLTSTPST
jgi:hypothetical protein